MFWSHEIAQSLLVLDTRYFFPKHEGNNFEDDRQYRTLIRASRVYNTFLANSFAKSFFIGIIRIANAKSRTTTSRHWKIETSTQVEHVTSKIRLEEGFIFCPNIYLQWPFKIYKYFLLHNIARVFKNTHLSYVYLSIILLSICNYLKI